jgi:hypothetical protein
MKEVFDDRDIDAVYISTPDHCMHWQPYGRFRQERMFMSKNVPAIPSGKVGK